MISQKKTGFLIRHAKILPLAFISTLAFGLLGGGDKSLSLLASNMYNWFGILITAQALSKRLSQKSTVNFLKLSFIKILNFQLNNCFKNKYGELLSKFSAIKIEDSTSFQLDEKLKKSFKGTGGAASKSAMKLNTCIDIVTNTITHMDIGSGIIADQRISTNLEKSVKKGELLIRDLGYFSIKSIQKMIALGVYFLSRLQKGILLFSNSSEMPLDLYKFLKQKTRNDKTIDQDLLISEDRVPIRLIAIKVPQKVKEQRISKFKKTRKKPPSQDYIEWCGYSIFVTNIPREWFSAKNIIVIYKIRWQIELFFKVLKQTLCIQIIRTKSKNATYSMIYAKLISLVLTLVIVSYMDNMCEESEEISVDKIIKKLCNDNRFGKAMVEKDIYSLLEELFLTFKSICKDQRQKKTTYGLIKEELSFLEVA